MRRTDLLVLAAALLVAAVLILPQSGGPIFAFTERNYLLGGFLKFFVFATAGDALVHRLSKGMFRVPGLWVKAIAWGVLGVLVALAFQIFPAGIETLQKEGVLPSIATPLQTSVVMNILFAPTLMFLHRLSDQLIDNRVLKTGKSLEEALKDIDVSAFSGMLLKTIPLFWIPAHTVTFILPIAFRPLFAALLGVALGIFLNVFKRNR